MSDYELVFYLIGMKIDLESERQVESSEASLYANSLNMKFYETSCKFSNKINELFLEIGEGLFFLTYISLYLIELWETYF